MDFIVVFDLFVVFEFYYVVVFQFEVVVGFFQVGFFDQYVLECFGIEVEGGVVFEFLVLGVVVDVFEVFEWVVGGYVGGFGD